MNAEQSLKELLLPAWIGWVELQVVEALGGDHASTRRTDNQFATQQERFDLIFQRVDRNIHRVPEGLNPDGTAAEDANDRIEIIPFQLAQPSTSTPSICNAARTTSSVPRPSARV